MRTIKEALIALIIVLGTMLGVAVAEDVTTPKLKDDVALSLRNLQVEVLILQNQEPVKRYIDLTQQLSAKYSSALKDSGIDSTKYQLDPVSLGIVAIPAKPAAVTPPAKEK